MVKRITTSALLIALAMIFSYIEVLIPFNFGIPGIKLGLANLVVVVAFYVLDTKHAFIISIIRIILVAFTFGNLAALMYSLAGGLLSFVIMALAKKLPFTSAVSVSVLGGIFHNIGQILVAILIVENLNLILYLPILVITGIITGLLIGFIANLILPALKKAK